MSRNELYPVFLKVSELNILIIGGGFVACEKLGFLLKSSPSAKVKVVATYFSNEIKELAEKYGTPLVFGEYGRNLMYKQQIVIAATNDVKLNEQIYFDAKSFNILINVADTPDLCDFYLGGIVTKGNVKIAISTNGKSPTMAKRLRQFFEKVLPENLDDVVLNLNVVRNRISGDFARKVSNLNELTKSLIEN
ncbi:MAG: siroheme synthase [Flavobacteriaceae bacterium]|nr:MAG: siroheme synthase [Flavobacteriaceae bacterium]